MEAVSVNPSSVKSWFLALRPKTLSAGIVPIAVGTFLTGYTFAAIDWTVAFCALFASLFIQIATNLINDVLDFKKGKDTQERLGPIRVTQTGLLSPKQVMAGGFLFLSLAALLGIPLIMKGGLPLLALMISAILCSYFYTAGPFPLAYVGLGEVFVVLFYGLFGTMGAYYLQTGGIQLDIFLVSIEIGLLTTVILAVNNARDIEEDKKTGKMTLAARFGMSFARKEITFLIGAAYFINCFWFFTSHSLALFLPMLTLPFALNLIKGIYQYIPSKIYNRFLAEASLLLILFSLLLILGFRIV